MQLLIGFFVFLFGLCVGSFLNVVLYRLGTKETVGGRSHCMSCGKTLAWYELLPLASFVIQRGKCRSCGGPISWQYPAVELLTALSFVVLFSRLASYTPYSIPDTLTFLFYAVVVSLCILITVYDIKHTIVPNEFVYPLIVLSLIPVLFQFGETGFRLGTFDFGLLWHLAAGLILWAPLALLWLVSQGRWIGLGDAKIAWAFGWLFGLGGGLSAIVFGFWIGAAVSLLLLGVARLSQQIGLFKRFPRLTMKTELPFVPFLMIGALLVALFEWNLSTLIGL